MTPTERFWSKVDKSGDCWLWTAAIDKGYGSFTIRRGEKAKAHRYAYQELVGPIPVGLTLDHLCRNRACVNPAHLEPVTLGVNVLRGEGPGANNRRKSHCPKGHPYDRTTVEGWRRCEECSREYHRQYRNRLRGAKA